MSNARLRSLVIYLPDLSGGGAERLHLNLAPRFLAAGWAVTFLLDRRSGDLLAQVPEGVAVEVLGAGRQVAALPKLVAFLRRSAPDIMVVNMEHMNVMAVLARQLAGVTTRIVATQHIVASQQVLWRRNWQFRILPVLYRLALPRADAIVAVSCGVARDLAAMARLPVERIDVIYNGVVDESPIVAAPEPATHAWLRDGGPPVILAMGRMVDQKDFATLLHAFARVAAARPARLLILGDGPNRPALEALVVELGLVDIVAMPGFRSDAGAALAAARLLVLSSRFEGFGNVLAEALAHGTPVVSTDCPHGPREILADGRFGGLVPVADPPALAAAILAALAEQPHRAALRSRGQDFSVSACALAYLTLFDRLHGGVDRATDP